MENFNNINELSLKQLKIKYNKFVNNESKELIKNKIKNQQNMCYICCGELDIHNDNNLVVKTKCNHFFHYECLKISHMKRCTYLQREILLSIFLTISNIYKQKIVAFLKIH